MSLDNQQKINNSHPEQNNNKNPLLLLLPHLGLIPFLGRRRNNRGNQSKFNNSIVKNASLLRAQPNGPLSSPIDPSESEKCVSPFLIDNNSKSPPFADSVLKSAGESSASMTVTTLGGGWAKKGKKKGGKGRNPRRRGEGGNGRKRKHAGSITPTPGKKEPLEDRLEQYQMRFFGRSMGFPTSTLLPTMFYMGIAAIVVVALMFMRGCRSSVTELVSAGRATIEGNSHMFRRELAGRTTNSIVSIMEAAATAAKVIAYAFSEEYLAHAHITDDVERFSRVFVPVYSAYKEFSTMALVTQHSGAEHMFIVQRLDERGGIATYGAVDNDRSSLLEMFFYDTDFTPTRRLAGMNNTNFEAIPFWTRRNTTQDPMLWFMDKSSSSLRSRNDVLIGFIQKVYRKADHSLLAVASTAFTTRRLDELFDALPLTRNSSVFIVSNGRYHNFIAGKNIRPSATAALDNFSAFAHPSPLVRESVAAWAAAHPRSSPPPSPGSDSDEFFVANGSVIVSAKRVVYEVYNLDLVLFILVPKDDVVGPIVALHSRFSRSYFSTVGCFICVTAIACVTSHYVGRSLSAKFKAIAKSLEAIITLDEAEMYADIPKNGDDDDLTNSSYDNDNDDDDGCCYRGSNNSFFDDDDDDNDDDDDDFLASPFLLNSGQPSTSIATATVSSSSSSSSSNESLGARSDASLSRHESGSPNHKPQPENSPRPKAASDNLRSESEGKIPISPMSSIVQDPMALPSFTLSSPPSLSPSSPSSQVQQCMSSSFSTLSTSLVSPVIPAITISSVSSSVGLNNNDNNSCSVSVQSPSTTTATATATTPTKAFGVSSFSSLNRCGCDTVSSSSDGNSSSGNDTESKKTLIKEIGDMEQSAARVSRVVKNFARYIPLPIVRMYMKNREMPELKLEPRKAVVMFLDVANFTRLSEQLGGVMIEVLNKLFEECSHILIEHGAVIDKYIGDAIMALWNVPEPIDFPEAHAAKAAIRILQRLDQLNADYFPRRYGRTMGIRIGINCGDVYAGNVGVPQRMNYTVLGNNVNIAARLEPLNKELGTRILVTDLFRRACAASAEGADVIFRCLGSTCLRGMKSPVVVHQILGDSLFVRKFNAEKMDLYLALDKVLNECAHGVRTVADAKKVYEDYLSRNPNDKAIRFFYDNFDEVDIDKCKGRPRGSSK